MKILCLGNNTEDTDIKTQQLAHQAGQSCHGLLSELETAIGTEQYQQPGYYHSSVYDVKPGRLRELMAQFDQVIMLDQPKHQWSHPYAFNNTIEMVQSQGDRGQFLNPALAQPNLVFGDLIKNNKSFCLFPFVQLSTFADGTSVCCHSNRIITQIDQLKDWQTDPDYQQIRQRMLAGVRMPEHCDHCYQQEDRGLMSPRQVETTEWAQRLDLNSVSELLQVKNPFYYDIRPSNKCNLMCRMCNPDDSHLIAREYKKLGLTWTNTRLQGRPKHYVGFDVVDLDCVQKLLVAGGEPSVMIEFYEFLEQCVTRGRTDFEINITTNANRFTSKFKNLLKNFSNVNFIVSIDGYEKLNHYIRYPSNWNSVVKNLRWLIDQGRPVSVHTTISIYNINSLHRLYQFMDQEFPDVIVDWDVIDYPRNMSHQLFPDRESAIESLTAVIKTNCYKNAGTIFRQRIDDCLQYFVQDHRIDPHKLKDFFVRNDLLDQSRSIWLADHVPELDKYRSSIV